MRLIATVQLLQFCSRAEDRNCGEKKDAEETGDKGGNKEQLLP